MRFLVLIVFLYTVFAEEQEGKGKKQRSVYQEAMDFVRGCGNEELSLCLKEKGLRYLETLPNNLDIGFGLRIKSNDPGEDSRASSSSVVLPSEPRAREQALDEVILEKMKEYVKSHALEYKLPNDTFEVLDGSMEEGRKKKGRRSGFRLRPMMMLLQVKAAMLGALALKFIGLVAFKALLIGKVALMIASLVALKKIAEPKHRSSTYEVVAHPHYEDHDHFDRAFNPEGPYKGYGGGARKLR